MDFGQVVQVIVSLAVVGLALWFAARYARKNMALIRHDSQTRIVSRHGISRAQNLVEVESNGRRHLVALTDGGAELIDSWDAPEPDPTEDPNDSQESNKFTSVLSKALSSTQWSGLSAKKDKIGGVVE